MFVTTLSRLKKMSVTVVSEFRRQELQMRASSQPQSGQLLAGLVDHRPCIKSERFKRLLEFDACAGFLKPLLDLFSFCFRHTFFNR